MLGTLAKWLRLLGHDCFYERDVADERLVELARAEGRILLTRDRRVARRSPSALYIPPGGIDDELFVVHAQLALVPPDHPPTIRCSLCNALLVVAAPSELAASGLPPRVLEEHKDVWRCPACARMYWEGTHVASMEVRLAGLRARLAAAQDPKAAAAAGAVKSVK